MVTSFTRIVVVLSFLRTAIGLQQTPPNAVLVGLALFLTVFVMAPTFETSLRRRASSRCWPSEIDEAEALRARASRRSAPSCCARCARRTWRCSSTSRKATADRAAAETPLRVLVPAFMISELRRAFEIGFLLFLPFLIIDMVVASILMSMGMMMLPPVMISLPFKLIFFVLVDGWSLVAGSLVQSFGPL